MNREAVNQPSKKLEGVFFNEDEAKILDLIRTSSKQNLSYKLYQKHRLELESLYRNNSVLVQRYDRLLELENPKNILLLSIHSGTPNFNLMIKVHHLYLSNLAFNKNVKAIVQYTHTLIAKTENVPLLDKMVYLSMISNNLDILNDLRLLNSQLNIELNQFNQKQLSIRNALSAEVGSISEMLNLINEHEKLAEFYGLLLEKKESGTYNSLIKNKFAHLLFLKNASLNLYVSNIYPAIHLSESSNTNLIQALKNQQNVEVKKSWIKNYLGQRIIGIGMPQWGRYAVRPRLVDQKIQVFNVLSKNRHLDLEQLNQNKDGYEYYRTETELCIKSPDPNQDVDQWEKHKSCLRI